jgi:hypothetical protein
VLLTCKPAAKISADDSSQNGQVPTSQNHALATNEKESTSGGSEMGSTAGTTDGDSPSPGNEKASDTIENSSTPNQGLVIGLSVAGALLVLVAMAFLIMRYIRPRKKDIVAFKVIQSHSPRLDDEIQLNMGDIVVLKEKFDDGWAIGTNITTNSEGNFPFNCLSEMEKPENS